MQRQEPLKIDPETILTVHLLTCDSRSASAEQERESLKCETRTQGIYLSISIANEMKMRRAPSCAWGQLPSHSLPGMKIVCTFKLPLHYLKSFQSDPAHGTSELREALNVCLKFFPLCKAASVDFASFPKSLLLVEHTSAMQALSERTRSQVRIGTNNAKNANKLQKMDDNDTSTPQSIGVWQSKNWTWPTISKARTCKCCPVKLHNQWLIFHDFSGFSEIT